MDVALYILDLLQEQDEVGVPGFGTFFKQTSAAYYHRQSGNFLPPGLRIFFREDTTVPDTLLSRYISNKKNISEDSANYFIEKYTDGVRKELETNGSFHADNLGIFTTSNEGIHFESATVLPGPSTFGLVAVAEPDYVLDEIPQQNSIVEEDAGLSETADNIFEDLAGDISPAAIQVDELTAYRPFEDETPPENETVTVEEISNEPASTTSQNVFEGFDQSIPLYHKNKALEDGGSDDSAEQDEDETDEPGPAKILLRISLALLIVSLLACTGYFYQDELKQALIKATILSAPVPKKAIPVVVVKPRSEDTIKVPDSFINQPQKQAIGTGLPDSTGVVSLTDTLANTVRAATYEVIGPTFITRRQALAFIKKMKAKKVNAHIADSIPGLRVKVSFGTFATETAAKQHLTVIQKNVFKDSYVQSIK